MGADLDIPFLEPFRAIGDIFEWMKKLKVVNEVESGEVKRSTERVNKIMQSTRLVFICATSLASRRCKQTSPSLFCEQFSLKSVLIKYEYVYESLATCLSAI